MIEIFVSRPTWVESKYENGLDSFLNLLTTLDLNPRTLGATDYPSQAPLDEVIELLEECEGAIILGYPQIKVASGMVKNKQVYEEVLLPTEWNHIEAGLAYARNLPLLVIHHIGISRGIFDRGAINSFIYEKDLSENGWPLSKDISGALKKWKRDVLQPKFSSQNTQSPKGEQLLCPNCTSRLGNVYLSPIPPDFHDIENATHECTRCNYKIKREDVTGK